MGQGGRTQVSEAAGWRNLQGSPRLPVRFLTRPKCRRVPPPACDSLTPYTVCSISHLPPPARASRLPGVVAEWKPRAGVYDVASGSWRPREELGAEEAARHGNGWVGQHVSVSGQVGRWAVTKVSPVLSEGAGGWAGMQRQHAESSAVWARLRAHGRAHVVQYGTLMIRGTKATTMGVGGLPERQSHEGQ